MSIPVFIFRNQEHFIKYIQNILPKKDTKTTKDTNLSIDIDLKHGLSIGAKRFKDIQKKPYYIFTHYTNNFDGVAGKQAIVKFIFHIISPDQYRDLVHYLEVMLGLEVYEYSHTK
ncbi:MAG: hypothetical protein L3J07_01875 [Candidatus Magasanikbacteria bacterium]|nr:hypothetical protein [Candidatus Magasanikbacteria bacterium]